MKSFKHHFFKTPEATPKYGKTIPYYDDKIDENDKIIKHFRETGLLDKYHNMKPPSNEETMEELMDLKNHMKTVTDDEFQFALDAENDESEMYRKFMRSLGVNLSGEFVVNVLDQVEPILMYLKKYHDRARPEQFASHFNIPYRVAIINTADHASYPSGHALDSYIIAYVFKQLKPDRAGEIDEFTTKMRESRLNVGLHYPSDNEISQELARDIIKSGLLEF
jgi:hypothetical protein